MTRKHSVLIKATALCLLLTMALPLLASCKSRAIPADKLALTPVGTVDGRVVYYEEIYFLAKNYLPTLAKKHGEGTDALRAALDEAVRENVVANYAMLRLCENEGLVYDESDKELTAAAQDYVDTLIQGEFEGKRGNYRDGIVEIGMTDHYLRFNAKVDALYAKLPMLYAERGALPTTDDAIRAYVKNHFARTWHVAVLVEDGESYVENRAKAEKALEQLRSGKTMYQMIGSKYNEDFSLTTTDGYYFPKGSMDKAYEDATFALTVGQTSDVVESTGISNKTGNIVPCFYIIERLPIDDEYVTSHLTALSDQCTDAMIATKLADVEKTLTFTPNEFYGTLDLANLEAPGDGVDVPLILTIGGIVLGVAALATGVVLLVLHKKKKKPRLPVKKS